MSDYEFPKHAAICALETGIQVKAYADGDIMVVLPSPEAFAVTEKGVLPSVTLTAEHARLLADALREAASIAEGP